MQKRALFIDRDGTLILETDNFKIEKFEKLLFYPQVFYWLGKIVRELDYELVMVTNQDGLGTPDFPEEDFWQVQHFIEKTFEGEGIVFSKVHIDKSYPHENLPTRKPGTGMLTNYMDGSYNLKDSFVIGDRITDVKLAQNLGSKCIWLNDGRGLGKSEVIGSKDELNPFIALDTREWEKVYEYLKAQPQRMEPAK